jgi:hypothetical protein
MKVQIFFVYFSGGLECVGHSSAYVAHLWFLRDVWIRTQSAAVASWRATNLATHPSESELSSLPSSRYRRKLASIIKVQNKLALILKVQT